MKRFGNLFNKITDLDNIILAHKNARKGKRHYIEVKLIDGNAEYYSNQIKQLLESGSYIVSEYKTFNKLDKGKIRKLYKLPYFPDRIIQHAIMQVLEPIWKSTLITDTHQAIKGRGVFTCLERVKRNVQEDGCTHCLQMDISKFYPSINNEKLKVELRRKIKCGQTLTLLDVIVDSCKGIPIGNYLSQYLGNICLSRVDRLMKEVLKVKYYYRYCDDIIMLSDDKEYLHDCRLTLTDTLSTLDLSVKPNYQLYEINSNRGIDFLGLVIYRNKVKVRKSIVKSFKEMTRVILTSSAKSIISYYGWFKNANRFELWGKYVRKYLTELVNKFGQKVLDYSHVKHLKRLCNDN